MFDEKIKKISDEKGLTVDEDNSGFSVKKNGHQIRYSFNEKGLVTFLQEFDEDKFQNDLQSRKFIRAEKTQPEREKVLSQTIIEVKEVVITDIQMSFNSMVFFMVKWAIASIPAFIIVMVLFYLAVALIDGIF
jgi:hypothetical protein